MKTKTIGTLLAFAVSSACAQSLEMPAGGTKFLSTGKLSSASAGKGDASDRALQFLASARGKSLGSSTAGFKLVEQKETKTGTHVRFAELRNGRPVFEHEVVVTVGRDGVSAVAGQLTRDSHRDEVAKAGQALVVPAVAKASACDAAATTDCGEPVLGYLATEDGRLLSVYQVSRRVGHRAEVAYIDATTGREARPARTVTMSFSAPGRVYKAGNPIAALDDPDLRDTSVIPSLAYEDVVLENLLTPSALVGSFVDAHSKLPLIMAAKPVNGTFNFQRSQTIAGAAFDAVMAYFHIDRTQQYLQTKLGRTDTANYKIVVNPYVPMQERNAFFSPEGQPGSYTGKGELEFGHVGVDAAEDAEVILHEYAHAMQWSQRPGIWFGDASWGTSATVEENAGDEDSCNTKSSGGTKALAEGFADYFAASTVSHLFGQDETPYAQISAEWFDAGNTPSEARNLLSTKTWPGSLSTHKGFCENPHADGEIWSATLWQLRGDLGPYVVDDIALESTYFLPGSGANFQDAARAMLVAAELLGYSDATIGKLLHRFGNRGILACEEGLLELDASVYHPLDGTDCGGVRKLDRWVVLAAPAADPYVVKFSVHADDFPAKLKVWKGDHEAEYAAVATAVAGEDAVIHVLADNSTQSAYYTVEVTTVDEYGVGMYTLDAKKVVGETLTNGNFEAGALGWLQNPASIIQDDGYYYQVYHPADGAFHAVLGGTKGSTDVLQQAPAFPLIQLNDKELSFSLRIVTEESGPGAYDTLHVRLLDSNGQVVHPIAALANDTQGFGAPWKFAKFTIPKSVAVKGHVLEFKAVNDGSNPTRFFIDAVSLKNDPN